MLTENDVIINCDESGLWDVSINGKTVLKSTSITIFNDNETIVSCFQSPNKDFLIYEGGGGEGSGSLADVAIFAVKWGARLSSRLEKTIEDYVNLKNERDLLLKENERLKKDSTLLREIDLYFSTARSKSIELLLEDRDRLLKENDCLTTKIKILKKSLGLNPSYDPSSTIEGGQ